VTYDAFAIDLWAMGVVITDMFDHILQEDESNEEEELRDPLDNNDSPRLVRKPLFNDEFGDIGLAGGIFKILGTPTMETWPVCSPAFTWADWKQGFDNLPDAGKIEFIHCDSRPLGLIFPSMNQELLDLTSRLLQLSPSHRLPAKEALGSAYTDKTLIPEKHSVWYGSDPRIDVSGRCVEEKQGRGLADHLAEQLGQKKAVWAISS
jgi:serine/threonine protein kinase